MGGRHTPRPTRRPVASRPGALTPRLVRVARPARRGKDDRHRSGRRRGDCFADRRETWAASRGRRMATPGRLEAHVSRLFPARRRALATTQGPKSGKEYYFNVATKESWDDPRRAARETEEARGGGPSGAGPSGAGAGPVTVHPASPARRQTPGRPRRPRIGGGPTAPGGEVVRIRGPNRPATDGRARGVPAQRRLASASARRRSSTARAGRGRAPAPTPRGSFFVSGVVAVAVLATVSSASRGWFDRSRRCARCAGRGGRRTTPNLWRWSFARWPPRSCGSGSHGPRSGRRRREWSELVADGASRSARDAYAKISCAIANAERAPEFAAVGGSSSRCTTSTCARTSTASTRRGEYAG